MRARNHHKAVSNTRCTFSSLLIKTYAERADKEKKSKLHSLLKGEAKKRTVLHLTDGRPITYYLKVLEKAVGTWIQRELILKIYMNLYLEIKSK